MRRTVTIDGTIYRTLQAIRGRFLESGTYEEISFTTVVNMVLLGGLIASDRLKGEDWQVIAQFAREQQPHLESESIYDRWTELFLQNTGKSSSRK